MADKYGIELVNDGKALLYEFPFASGLENSVVFLTAFEVRNGLCIGPIKVLNQDTIADTADFCAL